MRIHSLVRRDAGPAASTRATVQPLRWEWRTFAKRGEERLRSVVPAGAVAEPGRQETYLLSALSPNNIKARAGHIEVKALERQCDTGLELWRPTLRTALPIVASVARQLFEAWRIPAPEFRRESYSLDLIVREFVTGEKRLAAIPISKRRTRISPFGCQGEFAELQIQGESWWTVSIEATDPNLVAGAVVKLGLAGLLTSSYPAALKSITAGRDCRV